MTVRERRYPKEEFARRGNETYERDIRSQVEAANQGKIVVIDIETHSHFCSGRSRTIARTRRSLRHWFQWSADLMRTSR